MNAAEPDRHRDVPTLELREVGWRGEGGASASLGFSSLAQRIGWVGDAQPLLRALLGQEPIARGTARILGSELGHAIADGVLGVAPCDPELPPTFTVTEYLEHAARLTHGSRRRALKDAALALSRFDLGGLAPRVLSRLAPFERRALGIVTASLTSPPVVLLEAPLRGLDAPAADYIASLCTRAGEHSRVIVSSGYPRTPSAERTLLDSCDELFVIEHGVLIAHGSPSAVFTPTRHYQITVKGAQIAAFSSALSAAQCKLSALAQLGSFNVELPPESSTDLLLDTALAHDLTVLDLEPLRH